MRIGNDEKIVFSLLKKYPHLTDTNLQVLFTIITNKKRGTDKIIQSLKIKDLLDDKNRPIENSMMADLILEIKIDKEIMDNLQNLDEFIKLGKTAKSILYILSKIKKSSLQFLTEFLNESTRNTYAILQRLEEKSLVYSYNSKIYHLNTRGRRFSPKYYVITDLGKVVARMKTNTVNHDQLDKLLQSTQSEIGMMHKIFKNTKELSLAFFFALANSSIISEMELFGV